MSKNGRVKVGIIGSGFVADIHAESFQIMPDEAEVVAVASPPQCGAGQQRPTSSIPSQQLK